MVNTFIYFLIFFLIECVSVKMLFHKWHKTRDSFIKRKMTTVTSGKMLKLKAGSHFVEAASVCNATGESCVLR